MSVKTFKVLNRKLYIPPVRDIDLQEVNIMTNTTHLYQTGENIQKIQEKTDILEKDVQTIIEKDMETYLGVRFLVTEYRTGKKHGGIIDSLGIDENNVPVIIEYKRNIDSGAAIQGLFYLSWLMDHKSEFKLAVQEKLGKDVSENIDWSEPRVICIANDFKKYVIGAIGYMGPNIELMQYRLFNNGMLIIEDVYTRNTNNTGTSKSDILYSSTTDERLKRCNDTIREVYGDLKQFLVNLDTTVKVKETKNYTAFRTGRNFAVVKIFSKDGNIRIGANINPDMITLEDGFTEDARDIHGNDGPLHITIRTPADLEKAKPILVRSFDNS